MSGVRKKKEDRPLCVCGQRIVRNVVHDYDGLMYEMSDRMVGNEFHLYLVSDLC
jgi:hypothetical protein